MQIQATELTKRFGSRTVFNGLSCSAEPGNPLALIGPNGSGKTTLLLTLAGLMTPTEGELRYAIGEQKIAIADVRSHRAVVGPYGSLYADLTAVETIQFFAASDGIALTGKQIDSYLQALGLGQRGHDRVGEFSSGMKQRLKFAIALSKPVPFVFLDEPTANLDADGSAVVASLITDWSKRIALVVASNEPRDYEQIANQIRLR